MAECQETNKNNKNTWFSASVEIFQPGLNIFYPGWNIYIWLKYPHPLV